MRRWPVCPPPGCALWSRSGLPPLCSRWPGAWQRFERQEMQYEKFRTGILAYARIGWLCLVFLLGGVAKLTSGRVSRLVIGCAAHRVSSGAPPGPPIKEFQLTDENSKEFDSKQLKGHVWIGSFFYASCPGPCWQLNQALNAVQDEFKNTDLKLVSITCDPKNDSPEALRRYADRFQADANRWIFLTGDLDYIKRIGRDIFFQDVKEGQHRNSALVIDRSGTVRNSFDLLDPAEVVKLKALLKKLIDEKPPAENAETPAADANENKVSG